MTLRRSSQRQQTLETVLEELPARFYEADVQVDNGTMTGLARYVADLTEHLRTVQNQQNPPTIDVMTALGVPPSEWYRGALSWPSIHGTK